MKALCFKMKSNDSKLKFSIDNILGNQSTVQNRIPTAGKSRIIWSPSELIQTSHQESLQSPSLIYNGCPTELYPQNQSNNFKQQNCIIAAPAFDYMRDVFRVHDRKWSWELTHNSIQAPHASFLIPRSSCTCIGESRARENNPSSHYREHSDKTG